MKFTLLIFIFLNLAQAQEFKFSKLLSDKNRLLEAKYLTPRIGEDELNQINDELGDINLNINQLIYGKVTSGQIIDSSLTNSKNLYSYIINKLSPSLFKEIDKLKALIKDQTIPFDLGVVNLNGFEWQKPLGFVKLYAKREINQTFQRFPKTFRVDDHYIIEINAKTYLEKLSNKKLINILDSDLDAFAGLNFHRKFTFSHFHFDKEEAINSNLEKFLLPFVSGDIFKNFYEHELSIADNFTLRANAEASISWKNILSAGAKLEGSFESLRVAKIFEKDDQLIFHKKKSKNVLFDFSLNAKVDLFKLIKLTILDFGFNTEVQMAKEEIYKFTYEDLVNDLGYYEFLAHLNFDSIDLDNLPKFLDSSSKFSNKRNGFHYQFLGWDGSTSSETALREIVKNGEKHLFISRGHSKRKYTRTLLGTLSSTAADSLPLLNLFKFYKNYSKQNILITTDSKNKKFYEIEISREYYQKLKKKKDLKKALTLLKTRSTLGEELSLLDFSKFTNHLKVSSNIFISGDQTLDFLTTSPLEISKRVQLLCSGTKKCYEKIIKKYSKLNEAFNNKQELSKKLEKLIKKTLKYAKNDKDINLLFGNAQKDYSGITNSLVQNYSVKLPFYDNDFSSGRSKVEEILYEN